MSDDEGHPRYELARQVVLNFGAGLVAGYGGPLAGATAAGAVPAVLAGMDFIATTIGFRRILHATQALTDGADDYGAKTPEEFIEFVKAAVSDEDHQELLARALTIAQDTAMRDKRRALGRSLAQAARDTGTKVDEELLFIRVLADLDEPHIRLLRLMSTEPDRQWHPLNIIEKDPGTADFVWSGLSVLARHQLVSGGYEVAPPTPRLPDNTITPFGMHVLARLAEPE